MKHVYYMVMTGATNTYTSEIRFDTAITHKSQIDECITDIKKMHGEPEQLVCTFYHLLRTEK